MKKDNNKSRKFNLDEKVALTVNNPAQTKPLYCDITAEKLLLRSMLTDEDFFLLANDKLGRYSFSDDFNQSVFSAMRSAFEKNKGVSKISVCHELGTTYDADSDQAKGVRGLASFKTANNDVGHLSSDEFLQILGIVQELEYLRNSMREANRFFYVLLENKQQDKFSGRNFVAEHVNALCKMDEVFGADTNPKEEFRALFKETVLELETGKKEPIGLRTGISLLDWKLKGFKPGEMITFIATPGSGKSALMLSALYNMVYNKGNSCVYVSYEMNLKQVVNRICKMARANDQNLNSSLSRFEDSVDTNKLRFLDAEGLNIQQLYSKLLLMHRSFPLDCIFVDYLNNIPSASKTPYKNARIAEVSDGLRRIAKELDVPLVTAAQLDKVAARDARLPVAADIRDATEVADHSHKIVSIFRPFVHGIAEYEGGGKRFSEEETLNLAVLNICKNRDGEMGRVYAHFNAKATYFSNWADTNANFDPKYEEYLDAQKDSVEPSSNGTYTLPYDDVPF